MLESVLSSSIIPSIQGILRQAEIPLERIDGFAVGLGPGSFTSLRVGLSTVKALAFAMKEPIVGIPSLDILAMNVIKEKVSHICALCDAKRGLVYACVYERQGTRLKRKSKYLLTSISEILHHIKGETVFTGDGVGLFQTDILEHSKKKGALFVPIFADEKKWFPQAKHLPGLAIERFRKKKFDPIDKLVPLYLYPEDCQVRRQ